MKNKILLLFTDIHTERGIQKYNGHLLEALSSIYPEMLFEAIILKNGRKTGTWFGENTRLVPCGNAKNRLLQKAAFIMNTLKAVIKNRPLFIVCGHVNLSPLCIFFGKLWRIKYAVLTHGIECWQLRTGLRYAGLKNADMIVTVSRYSKQRMAENGIPENRVEIIHDTVDTKVFCRGTTRGDLLDRFKARDKRILLTTGSMSRYERYKGHDMMLDVLKDMGSGYVWLVAGDGDDLPRLKKKAASLMIEDRVHFLGKVENSRLKEIYNLCDLFIMPSKGEGFGIVFLEAMASGKPVIGSFTDGSTEPLMDGRLGFLVDPDDREQIKKSIEKVFLKEDERTDPVFLSNEVKKYFGIEAFKKRIKEVFLTQFK